MFGFAAWQVVKVDIVAHRGLGDNRILLVLAGELGKRAVRLAVDYGVLFDPSNLIFFGFDFEEAAAMLQDFQRLPVDHLGHAVGHCGDAVVQEHVLHGDVDRIGLWLVELAATD